MFLDEKFKEYSKAVLKDKFEGLFFIKIYREAKVKQISLKLIWLHGFQGFIN